MLLERFKVSQRRACLVLNVHRKTAITEMKQDDFEKRLTAEIIKLAKDYGLMTAHVFENKLNIKNHFFLTPYIVWTVF
jgi:hypothetical protein